MTRRLRNRGASSLVMALLLLTFGGMTPIAFPGAAQEPAVPGLGGTALVATTSMASGACWTDAPASFDFSASGYSSGSYSGTFMENGTVTIGGVTDTSGTQVVTGFESQFTIESAGGVVSGTKWFVSDAMSPSEGTGWCEPLEAGGIGAEADVWNIRYEATITTPDGRICTTAGTSTVEFAHNSINPNRFVETHADDVDALITTCTGGGGGEEPPIAPLTKDDCKQEGWQAYGFPNQGQCIDFVNHRA